MEMGQWSQHLEGQRTTRVPLQNHSWLERPRAASMDTEPDSSTRRVTGI